MNDQTLESILEAEYADFLTREFLSYSTGISKEVLYQWNLSLIQASKKGSLAVPVSEKQTPISELFRDREGLLYFRKTFEQLESIETGFRKLIALKNNSKTEGNIQNVIEEITVTNPLLIGKDSKEFILCGSGEQKDALVAALSHPFFVLTGGPGTGKTTVVASLLRGLVRSGYSPSRIALAAPTGRAAQRLKESLDNTLAYIKNENETDASLSRLQASTLHRLLQFNPRKRSYKYGKTFSLPFDVIVVDEASMVDLGMMYKLMGALPVSQSKTFRLILLGDSNQLPSVETGAILSDLVGSLKQKKSPHLVELLTSRRQEEGAGSISAAAKVCIQESNTTEEFLQNVETNVGIEKIESVLAKKGFFRIELDYSKNRQGLLETYAEHFILPNLKTLPNPNHPESVKEYLIKDLNRSRILTILRNGFFGSESINSELTRILLSRKKEKVVHIGGRIYFAGLPLMITKNDRVRGVFNGDTGVVLTVQTPNGESELRALFVIEGTIRDFALDTLPSHEPAFAITVHKSQGSEYDSVIILYPPDPAELMEVDLSLELFRKEILYTALTRAKQNVFLVAENRLLEYSLMNRFARITGFQL